jgi:hypothetical protein
MIPYLFSLSGLPYFTSKKERKKERKKKERKVHFFSHPCSQCLLAVLKGPVTIGKREKEGTAKWGKTKTAAKNTIRPLKENCN